MNELMEFEGNKVKIIQDENGNPLFEIYSTGMALGYARSNGKTAGEHGVHPKLFPYKSRIDVIFKNAEITPCIYDGHKYINESQLYDFMLEARTDKCRKFRKWVTNEILPSIRKTGSYTMSNSLQLPCPYINKTFRGRPVLTTSDMVNIYGLKNSTLYNYIKSELVADRDYNLLQGEKLKQYNKENTNLLDCRRSVFVIYNTGLSRLVSHFELDANLIPDFMRKAKGYITQACVKSLMDYVRRELKGVESLTYLLESDDSAYNLENYRNILVKKLSRIVMWGTDVATVKLGIHKANGTELVKIGDGTRGLRY